MSMNLATASEPWFSPVTPQLISNVSGFVAFLQRRLMTSGPDAFLIQKKIDELNCWMNVASKCVGHPEFFDIEINLIPEPVDIVNLCYGSQIVQAVCFGNGRKTTTVDMEEKFCDFSGFQDLSVAYLLLEDLREVARVNEKRKIFVALSCEFDPVTMNVVNINEEKAVLKVVGKLNNALQDAMLRRESKVHGMLSMLGHESINNLLRVGEDKGSIYTVSSFGGRCDAMRYLKRKMSQTRHPLDESEVRRLFKGVVYSLAVVHNLGIAHRDISLENLVKNETTLEIIDWGLCCKFDPKKRTTDYQGAVGKRKYFAPELVMDFRSEGDMIYDPTKTDVFALGVCMFCCLLGEPPFEEMGNNAKVGAVLGNLRGVVMSKKTQLSEVAMDLLEKTMDALPEERLSMHQMLDHPFFSNTD